MLTVTIVLIGLLFVAALTSLWVGGIDYMQKNHPDYKGEDFLNTAGRDGWDDNSVHTENEI